jgi:hypothetical protein
MRERSQLTLQFLTTLYLPLTVAALRRSIMRPLVRLMVPQMAMKLRRQRLLGGFNRYRLLITLGLAVLLPAAALIYVNFSQLRAFERDKVLQAIIHRDFEEVLAITEKKMNKKAYAKVEGVMNLFPWRKDDDAERESKLNDILAKCTCFSHAFIWDGEDLTFQTQVGQMTDRYVREEHDQLIDSYRTSFSNKEEVKWVSENINKSPSTSSSIRRKQNARMVRPICSLRFLLCRKLQAMTSRLAASLRSVLPEEQFLSGNARRFRKPEIK